MSVPVATYTAHENGGREFGYEEAEAYARRFKVPVEWLAFDIGDPAGYRDPRLTIVLRLWDRLKPYVQDSIITLIKESAGDEVPGKEQVDKLGKYRNVNGDARDIEPKFPGGKRTTERGPRKSKGS